MNMIPVSTAAQAAAALPLDHDAETFARVIDTMDRIIDQETTIVTDAGSFSRWIHRYRRFERPHTKAGPMSGAMGYSVPGAVGAKLARPDHEVIVEIARLHP